ncbi:G-protein alpha subunit-domain-containing protein [Xylariaceae sp. FL0804]|nr:G-protein alpha subunit-domain-containing protein [Xylariaceae sp. FL0804]
MDPVTIVSIVGTVVSLGDVVLKCITRLSLVKAKFHDAPLCVTSMIGQLHMVKVAQDELSTLSRAGFGTHPRYRQLAAQVDNALVSFGPLMVVLQQCLDQFDQSVASGMTARGKMRFLIVEREITNLSILLDRQVNALNLLLQATQCSTWTEQQKVVSREDNQSILRLAQECSSSLAGVDDISSFVSEDTDTVSTRFEFDRLILGTNLYQRAERSHLRQAIRAGKLQQARGGTTDRLPDSSPSDPPWLEGGTIDEGVGGSVRRPRSYQTGREVPVRLGIPSWGSTGPHDTAADAGVDLSPRAADEKTVRSLPPPGAPASKSAPQGKEQRWSLLRRALYRSKSERQTPQPPATLVHPKPDPRRKILLLGTSDSGKSTLLKLMLLAAQEDPFANEVDFYRSLLWSNAVELVVGILKMKDVHEVAPEWDANITSANIILRHNPAMFPHQADEVAVALSSLCDDPSFKRMLKYELHEDTDYYIGAIDRLATSPASTRLADGDILRTRVTTTGTHETLLTLGHSSYSVWDVGGERSERRKWKHVFQDVSTVMFAVDPTGYGEQLREDNLVNSMAEQLSTFSTLFASSWFGRSNIIVIFTKMDLLRGYIHQRPVSRYLVPAFGDHTEEGVYLLEDVDGYLAYLEAQFRARMHSAEDRERILFLRVNAVDIDPFNSAVEIFDLLESLARDFPQNVGISRAI